MPTTRDVYTIKKGDTLPALTRTLKFDDGTVYDLSSATAINFIVAPRNGLIPDYANATTFTGSVVGAATDGVVQYAWAAGDTSTLGVGDFYGEFEVIEGTDRITFPNGKNQYIHICIVQDVNNT